MSEPITTALRGLLCARPLGDPCWDAMDAVDAVHAALEAENAELRAKVEELDNVGGSMHDGGSITDELREYAADPIRSCKSQRKLFAIADRIDAEHESACKRERGEGIKIAEEAAMEEMRQEYVKLPVDADGVPIHIGDVVEWCDSGETLAVEGIGIDVLFYIDGENAEWTAARNKRHHHAPTVEGILRDFGVDIAHALDADPDATVPEATIAKYAAKLRLAGDAE